MKFFACFVLFLFPLIHVSAQGDFRRGFIITNSNDSISGFVKYKNRKGAASSCEFRREKRGRVENYHPGEIKSYGFLANKRFVSRTVKEDGKKKELFLDQLVLGKLSLLRSIHYFYLEGDSLMMLKPEQETQVESEKGTFVRKFQPYKGQLNYVFRECRLSAEYTEYNETSLSAIVQNYNRCKGTVGQRFKEKIPATKVNYSLFSGVHGSRLIIDDADKNAFSRDWSPVIGGGLNFSAPRIFDRLSFGLEGFYTQKKYVGTLTQEISGGMDYFDIKIEYPSFQFGLGLQYNVLKESSTPYFKIGYGRYLNGNGTLGVITEKEINGTVTTEIETYNYKSNNQGAFVVTLGYQVAFYSRLKIFGEIRYERTGGFDWSGQPTTVSVVDNINFFVGLRF